MNAEIVSRLNLIALLDRLKKEELKKIEERKKQQQKKGGQ